MAKLNLKYYNAKDKYSDGDIEDTVLSYIQSKKDYDDIIDKDQRWPVYYHLSSFRENILEWYNFPKNAKVLEIGAGCGAITGVLAKKNKSVTCVELSKRRSQMIQERYKNVKNIEIIVGNFNDIEFKEKYDYITLIGVLEYASLYTNTDTPYVDFLNKIKQLLKPDGTILIAIENRLGLKYWCGANEDHLDQSFVGLNDYPNSPKSIRTFDKSQLQDIMTQCGLHSNFYYVFPDYKFPELILTDNFLKETKDIIYGPYYCHDMSLIAEELKLFKSAINNNVVPFFANSFFVEASIKKKPQEIQYVKYNNMRKRKYHIYTYEKDNKFYKAPRYTECKDLIKQIAEQNNNTNNKLKIIPIETEKNRVYTKKKDYPILSDTLYSLYLKKDYKKYISIMDEYYKYLTGLYFQSVTDNFKNISIGDTNIPVPKDIREKLTFIKNGYIDLIPTNIMVKDDEYLAFDQEWIMHIVPLDYILFRSIHIMQANYQMNNEFITEVYKHFGIQEYLDFFTKIEESFQAEAVDPRYKSVIMSYALNGANKYHLYNTYMRNYESLVKSKEELEQKIDELKAEYDTLAQEYNNVVNSKSWKMTQKIRDIKKKISH